MSTPILTAEEFHRQGTTVSQVLSIASYHRKLAIELSRADGPASEIKQHRYIERRLKDIAAEMAGEKRRKAA